MVGIETALRLVGGGALLLGNGYFVTIEFAMTRLRQFPASDFTGPGLERAWEMTERLEIFLSGCQVGITVCSVGLGVVAEPAVAAAFGDALGAAGLAGAGGHTTTSVILALAVINMLHVIVGEQAPTYLGVEESKLVARYGAGALYYWTKLMYPVIAVADWTAKGILGALGVKMTRSWTEAEEAEAPSTRGELRRQMGESLSRMDIPAERREEVLNALDIGTRTVEDVMVDREDVVALSTTDDLETTLERLAAAPHARYPLVGEELSDLRGILYTPALLRHLDEIEAGDLNLSEVAAPPMTVDPSATVATLIDRFQAENQELALVLDRGEAVGMVTTTDAFEAITGELQDPLDLELSHVD